MRIMHVSVALLFCFPVGEARAQNLNLYLNEVALTGPVRFVKWADEYYAERENGQSGFQQSGSATGSAMGALVGGALGLALGGSDSDDGSDNTLDSIKNGAENGKEVGSSAGQALGNSIGQSQQLEDVITNYMNDRSQVLQQIQSVVQACMSNGSSFSDCSNTDQIAPLVQQITQINYQYCQQAISVPSPTDPTQPILVPDLCDGN